MAGETPSNPATMVRFGWSLLAFRQGLRLGPCIRLPLLGVRR